ncbi:serine/threonine protein phosphatase [Hellea sp.]|nr:serine/threonine protein phosphatase [Hellea sp.]
MSLVYYAIGDIHGELAKLRALHERISQFHNSLYPGRPHTRIHLGDYVDRGPNSYGVLDYIQSLDDDEDFEVINLKGNHEILMLQAHQSPKRTALKHWLVNGGEQTLASYQEENQKLKLQTHLSWIENLPSIYQDKSRNLIFVHAGINPETYPKHDEAVHLWTRNATFFESEHWINPALNGATVIHGHTPTLTDYPDISKDGRRINVDTGACYGGPLSAVILALDEKPRFLFSD